MGAHVQHREATAFGCGDEGVSNRVEVVQAAWISRPEFSDYVLTQSIGHFPRRSSISRKL